MRKVSFKNTKLCLAVCVIGFTLACKSSDSIKTATNESIPETVASNKTSNTELEELYWARIESAKMNFVQADVDFMTMMIEHHAQALIMSDLAPKNGASPEIQVLAARIINAQEDEIAIMQTWLKDRNQPVPEVHIEGLNLMVHAPGMHHMDHSQMAGMLSQEQLEELDAAKGEAFDELFLEYMIQHHLGATSMVKDLVKTDGAVQDEAAFKLASDINADQKTEIARMRLMLQEIQAGLN